MRSMLCLPSEIDRPAFIDLGRPTRPESGDIVDDPVEAADRGIGRHGRRPIFAGGNHQSPKYFIWSRSSIIPAFCVGRHPSRCCVSALDAGMSIPAKSPSQPK
jgi:hypothetical protein